MNITLPRPIVTRILMYAQEAPETEVCGLIAAHEGVPGRIYPIANVARDSKRFFEMDPAGQIEAMRQMRERGENLFAIYHSHPHAPPEPSARDLAEAAYPDALYLVISLNTGGVLELRGFRLRDGRAAQVDIQLG